jgi:hypothetical protein
MRLSVLCFLLLAFGSFAQYNSIEKCFNSLRDLVVFVAETQYYNSDLETREKIRDPDTLAKLGGWMSFLENLGVKMSREQLKAIFSKSFVYVDAVGQHCSDELLASDAEGYLNHSSPAVPKARVWISLLIKITRAVVNGIKGIGSRNWRVMATSVTTLYSSVSEFQELGGQADLGQAISNGFKKPDSESDMCKNAMRNMKRVPMDPPKPRQSGPGESHSSSTSSSFLFLNMGEVLTYCFRLNK